jgi:small subunit ribosomal protein S16
MLKIKLQRTGKRSHALYRIVVAEAKSKRDGKVTDLLGTYDPHTNPSTFTLNVKQYNNWLKKGAQPTETVRKLAKSRVSPTK